MSGGFADLGLLPELLQAIDDQGWLLPTDIQDEAIPLILGGGDVMGAAETGSGKTAAFALPVLQCVYERLKQPTAEKRKRVDSEAISIRLNELDCDAEIKLHADGLTCEYANADQWVGVRATHGVYSGKYYFECILRSNGNCRVGWSTRLAHLDLGKDRLGFGYGAKGFKSCNGSYEKYGETYSINDVIGCLINMETWTVRFSKNGQSFDTAYEIPSDIRGSVFFPSLCLSGSVAELVVDRSALRFLPPGFLPLAQATVQDLLDSNAKECFGVHGKRKPMALIVEPTRDLAEQVYQSLLSLSRHITEPILRCALLIGDDPRPQDTRQRLQEGVDIVVGTLGKLTACVQSHQLDLSFVRFFILDEADRLVSADNLEQVHQLYAKCPAGGTGWNRLQVCFFSATLHDAAIKSLAEAICQRPTWIDLKGHEVVPDTLHHVILPVSVSEDAMYRRWVPSSSSSSSSISTDGVHESKEFAGHAEAPLCVRSQHIKELKPFLLQALIDKFQMQQVIVFVRTNLDAQLLEQFFQRQSSHKTLLDKYTCAVLGGALRMEDRRRNLQRFKDGEVRILVCTDVAARGIDIDSLPYVVNMTLPEEAEDYIHRVGRAGRAERMGLAISLVCVDAKEKVWYHTCQNKQRGAGCTNRAVKEKGGCTTWMQEALQWAKIEKRLNLRIPALDSETLDLPDELRDQKVRYGESIQESEALHGGEGAAGGGTVYMTERRIGTIKTLTELERTAQNCFLTMHQIGTAST